MGFFKKRKKYEMYTAQGAYQKVLANIGRDHSEQIQQISQKISGAVFCNRMSICINPWPAEYWPIVTFLKALGYKLEFHKAENSNIKDRDYGNKNNTNHCHQISAIKLCI